MHSLNLPHWMWDVGVIFMPYSCSGFILVGCPNGVLEELETILKKLKLKQNFKLYKHNINTRILGIMNALFKLFT